MITIDGLSSMTFMSLNDDKSPHTSPPKPRYVLDGEKAVPIYRPPPNTKAIVDHVLGDLAASDWTPLSFPFSFHVASAIYRKQRHQAFTEIDTPSPRDDMSTLRRLATVLISDMADEAQALRDRFVVLLIPPPDREGYLDPALKMLQISLSTKSPLTCVIDPSPELIDLARHSALRSVSWHFSADGNKALALAAERGIRACGIAP
jgi:hypothetical protein